MCTRIEWPDGEVTETQGELAEKVGDLPIRDGYQKTARDDDTCLCPVDVQRVLREAGVSYRYNRGWDEYVVEED